MESITQLPESLGVVEIPRQLNVTRLASSGPCLLRPVAPLERIPREPAGPRAEFGRIVHRLLDLCASGRLGTGETPSEAAEAFDYLVERAKRRLSSDTDTQRYADLSAAFGNQEWAKSRWHAIARAKEVARKPHPRPHTQSLRNKEPPSLSSLLNSNMRIASEVAFESTTLRITGRMDLLETQPTEVRISDYKSGKVFEADGSLSEEIVIQLQLYGLAVIDLTPQRRVSLRVIGSRGEAMLPFGDEERRRVREWLMTRLEQLPVGAQVHASQLAVVGPQCRRCGVRVVCPKYREAVADLWMRTDGQFAIPLDVAGTVIEGNQQDEYTWVKLRDLSGRTVKVHRLRPAKELTFSTEEIVWFFDLASIEARGSDLPWRHPRNFHEIASFPGEETAWTLRAFSTNTQSRDD